MPHQQDIDTPGHEAAIAYSHPEFVACAFSTPVANFASEPPAGQLRLADPATTNFTAKLIAAVAKTVWSSMFSTGGDELNTNCYTQDNQTQADLQSSGRTLDQALSDFLEAEHAGIRALNKTPVVKAGVFFLLRL
jgi:hexosaminidase